MALWEPNKPPDPLNWVPFVLGSTSIEAIDEQLLIVEVILVNPLILSDDPKLAEVIEPPCSGIYPPSIST